MDQTISPFEQGLHGGCIGEIGGMADLVVDRIGDILEIAQNQLAGELSKIRPYHPTDTASSACHHNPHRSSSPCIPATPN